MYKTWATDEERLVSEQRIAEGKSMWLPGVITGHPFAEWPPGAEGCMSCDRYRVFHADWGNSAMTKGATPAENSAAIDAAHRRNMRG